jgi:hypothetical protein
MDELRFIKAGFISSLSGLVVLYVLGSLKISLFPLMDAISAIIVFAIVMAISLYVMSRESKG